MLDAASIAPKRVDGSLKCDCSEARSKVLALDAMSDSLAWECCSGSIADAGEINAIADRKGNTEQSRRVIGAGLGSFL